MPATTARLLRELALSWATLEPLPSLDARRFERFSLEAAQVLEVVAGLERNGASSGHQEVDRELLVLAVRCRELGECGMSATLARTAAARGRERHDHFAVHHAEIVEGASYVVGGERQRACEHLIGLRNRLMAADEEHPFVGEVQSLLSCMVDDVAEAQALCKESLDRLERTPRKVFERVVGDSFDRALCHRHAGMAQRLIDGLWQGGGGRGNGGASHGNGNGNGSATRASIRAHLDAACRAWSAPLETAEIGVIEAELALVYGEDHRGLEILRELEREGSERRDVSQVLAPTYRLLAQFVARHGDRETAIEYCRRALLASLHCGNRRHESLVVETFMEIMRETHQVDETSAGVGKLADVLIEMLAAKDWYTGRNHSQSVGSLAARMGRSLVGAGVAHCTDPSSPDWLDLDVLKLAGQLHDVGKLAIPWSLLNKINPLEDQELTTIRSHSRRSEEMLDQLGLHRVGLIAGQHHERPDGRGYPRGGRGVTLMGGVVAVADAFEAMITSNRRYRARKTRDEAIAELQKCSGVMFDPRAVDALVASFRRRGSID